MMLKLYALHIPMHLNFIKETTQIIIIISDTSPSEYSLGLEYERHSEQRLHDENNNETSTRSQEDSNNPKSSNVYQGERFVSKQL